MDYLKFKSRLQHSGTVEVNGRTLQHGGEWAKNAVKYIDKIWKNGKYRYIYQDPDAGKGRTFKGQARNKVNGMLNYARSAASNGIQSARSVAGDLRDRAATKAGQYSRLATSKVRQAKATAGLHYDDLKKAAATKAGQVGRLATSKVRQAKATAGLHYDDAKIAAKKKIKETRIDAKRKALRLKGRARYEMRKAESAIGETYDKAVRSARRTKAKVDQGMIGAKRKARMTGRSITRSAKQRYNNDREFVNAFINDRIKRKKK